MDILKEPMDTAEFFTKICGILDGKGIMPGILDYAVPAHNPVLITTSGFSFRNNLDYGSNEGIYLDIWITFDKGGRNIQKGLGTFKTLLEDGAAMETMGRLLAGFIVEGYQYINSNPDNFNWEGIDVYAFDSNGNKAGFSYSCKNMDSAVCRKDRLLKKYPRVAIRDNATHNEKFYEGGIAI